LSWKDVWAERMDGVKSSLQHIRDVAHKTLQVSTPDEREFLQRAIDRVGDIFSQTHADVMTVTKANTQLALHYSVARMRLFENQRAANIAAGKEFLLIMN